MEWGSIVNCILHNYHGFPKAPTLSFKIIINYSFNWISKAFAESIVFFTQYSSLSSSYMYIVTFSSVHVVVCSMHQITYKSRRVFPNIPQKYVFLY